MMTVEEYIFNQMPDRAFLYMPDVVTHILKQDTRQTVFKCPEVEPFWIKGFIKALNEPAEPPEIFDSCLDSYNPRRRHKELDADSGDIEIDRYLNGDPRPFIDVFSIQTPRPARTILIDSCLSANERHDDMITEQHKAVYMEALKAEADGTPFRVIACRSSKINERPEPYTVYIVIKDWNDPIFPNIWGALKTSKSTNDFGNCFQDFITGSYTSANGRPSITYYENDFPPEEEIILINPVRIRKNRTTHNT